MLTACCGTYSRASLCHFLSSRWLMPLHDNFHRQPRIAPHRSFLIDPRSPRMCRFEPLGTILLFLQNRQRRRERRRERHDNALEKPELQ